MVYWKIMTQTIGVLLQNIAVSFKISLQTMLGAQLMGAPEPGSIIGAQDWTLYFSDKENTLVAVPPTRIG